MTERDWVGWHERYDEPGSSLQRRLALVQARIAEALDGRPPGPIRVLSMCAGQGRDLLGVLRGHPRRADVTALLVEQEPALAEQARSAAREAGLDGVRVLTGDAASTTVYADLVPVDLALVCGVFGNISDDDIRATVAELPRLCRTGATVIWTRHRRAPDRTPTVRRWFAELGFAEVAFEGAEGYELGVGTHRLVDDARPYRPDVHLFDFTGDGADAHT